jgi:thiamine-phosphate pyrophosphorylase
LSAADLGACRLYGILDLAYVARADAARVAHEMIEGGVDILQLRAKHENVTDITAIARALQAITSSAHIPFVINDYAHVARDVGADGVHVGQDDISVAEVRKLLGSYGFVGKSTHSLEQAIAAQTEGADYIGFGPLFATPTKPDYAPIGLNQIGAAHATVKLPIFCIGGIKLSNLADVVAAGARRVVIVSGLLQARDIAEYARSAKMLLTRGTQR